MLQANDKASCPCDFSQGFLPEDSITPVDTLPRLDDLKGTDRGDVQTLLKATAVLKLNGATGGYGSPTPRHHSPPHSHSPLRPSSLPAGGLGTSMGLEKAKSLLIVKDGHTFLDLIAKQARTRRADTALVESSCSEREGLSRHANSRAPVGGVGRAQIFGLSHLSSKHIYSSADPTALTPL